MTIFLYSTYNKCIITAESSDDSNSNQENSNINYTLLKKKPKIKSILNDTSEHAEHVEHADHESTLGFFEINDNNVNIII